MILFGLSPPHLRVEYVGRGEDEDVTDDDEDRAEDDIGLLQSSWSCPNTQQWHEAEVKTLQETPGVELAEDGGAGGDVAEEQQEDAD